MALPAYLIPVVMGAGGTGGFIWAAVNWRRDDTGKVVAQTGEIVEMLRALIDELEKALERAERYGERRDVELVAAHAEIERLRARLDDAERRLAALTKRGTDA